MELSKLQMETATELLTLSDLAAKRRDVFARVLRDDDCFTLLYELTYSGHPLPVEALWKTFGSDISYLSELLTHLQRQGLVIRKGSQWSIQLWAGDELKALESVMRDYRFDVSPSQFSETRTSLDLSFGTASDSTTYNGLWVGSVSIESKGVGPVRSSGMTEEPVKRFGSALPDRFQNETRSHDYK